MTLGLRKPLSLITRSTLLAAALAMAGCGSLSPFGPDKPKPAELGPNPATFGVRQAWTNSIGKVEFPLDVAVVGSTVAVAGGEGTVALLNADNGRDVWRASVGAPIAAGAGSDGRVVAVVTRTNELVALAEGRVLWRERLPAQVFTPPLVAGNRVFVAAGDRSVSAFDAQSGRRLWSQQRPGEPLVLQQAGVLLPFGDTLVGGQGGRMVGYNPLSGAPRWEAPIATPRGTNDIERLVDLVGRVSRQGNTLCARAFQAAIGCVDATRGSVLWTKPANGGTGLGGDGQYVVGAESDGRVVAWRRDNGERAWVNDKLLHRGVGTPLLVGRSVAVGDDTGLLHVLSREDGSFVNRLSTDGSRIVSPPVVAGQTMVVVTRNGGVFGFVPQ
jgi:outer membrane assembly lipoprotein YfgL